MHISIWEWRRYKDKNIINPEELSDRQETCYVPRWAKGALDALHEGAEDYLVTLLQTSSQSMQDVSRFSQGISSWLAGFVVTRIGTRCLKQHNFMGGSIIIYF